MFDMSISNMSVGSILIESIAIPRTCSSIDSILMSMPEAISAIVSRTRGRSHGTRVYRRAAAASRTAT